VRSLQGVWVGWLLLCAPVALASGLGQAPALPEDPGVGFTGGLFVGAGLHGPVGASLTRVELHAGARLSRRFALVATGSIGATFWSIFRPGTFVLPSYDWSVHGQHGVLFEWRPVEFVSLAAGPLLSFGRMGAYEPGALEYLGYADEEARLRPAIDLRATFALPLRAEGDPRRLRFTAGLQVVVLFLTDIPVLWPSGTTTFTLTSVSPLLAVGFEWR
jgi:hypothetical protein